MSGHHKQSQTLTDVWQLLRRYRTRFVLPAFLVAAGILIAGIFLPRKYQGEAIFERRNDLVLTEMASRNGSQPFETPRGSASEEIIGQPAIDQLIATIQPQLMSGKLGRRISTDINGLRGDLQRSLLVHFDISSAEVDRIRVTYNASNPELARLVVNTLVENYIANTRQAMDGRLNESAAFFDSEVERERKAIEDIENQMLTFEISHADMLPDSPTGLQSLINQSESQTEDLQQKYQSAVLHAQALADSVAGTSDKSPSVTNSANPDYARQQEKLTELQTELSNDLDTLRMTEKHPDVVALRQQILRIQNALAQTPQEVVTQTQVSANPKRMDMEVMLTTAQADCKALEAQVNASKAKTEKLTAQSASLFPVRADYRKLSRDAEQHRRQLTFWEDNLRRVRMVLAAESGKRGVQLDFIKPCPEVYRPVSPNVMQVLLAAVGLGLLAGASGVFMAQRTDESFADGDSLAKATHLPLLGSVSEIISEHQRRLRALRLWVFYPLNALALTAILIVLATIMYLSLEHPDTFALLQHHPAGYLLGHTSADASPDGHAE